jgi:DHA1 family tetracycline resistance protein-like MFS transporter
MNVFGRKFVVAKWDIMDEEECDHLVREFTEGNIGNFFAFVGIWIVITQAVITRFVSKKFSEQQVLKVSLLLFGICTLMYILPNAAWELYALVPLFSIFNGLNMANMTSLVSRSASGAVQGEVLGINASVQALAQAIPPILSGFIAAAVAVYFPILISGIILILAGIIFNVFFKPAEYYGTSS